MNDPGADGVGGDGPVADEPPPIFRRWSRLYALVIAVLALVIVLCGWLTRLR